ncbi:hypothetical protein SAMN04488524_3111 [Pedobacter africanus]|uniref:Glycolipid-binding n=2 Tax=Pedobacter africanus TaxID=151894 RepID=A0A1W2CQQ6_9SPHI|nr:hypothetical protein SAMN04488524_3111 [Pedobacter africanus]
MISIDGTKMNNTLTRIWKGKQSLEMFYLEEYQSQTIAGGIVCGSANDRNAAVKYQVTLDNRWRIKTLKIYQLTKPYKFLILSADYYKRWFDINNRHLPELDGCVDIDISVTPFTNSLPINRLGEELNETQSLKVVYIKVPEFSVLPVLQRYTRIAERSYCYENEHTGFRSDLMVDEQGLVVTYPELFERIYPDAAN